MSLTMKRALYGMFMMALAMDLFKPLNPGAGATLFCGVIIWAVSKVKD